LVEFVAGEDGVVRSAVINRDGRTIEISKQD
jgi:hypothetical protein